jgi:hypothetical protein
MKIKRVPIKDRTRGVCRYVVRTSLPNSPNGASSASSR